MNSSSSSPLPVAVHTEKAVTTAPPPVRRTEEPASPPTPTPPSRRPSILRAGVICLLVTAALGTVLISALRVARESAGGWGSVGGIGGALGQGLLQGGLPPAGLLPGESTTDDESTADSAPGETEAITESPTRYPASSLPPEPDTEETLSGEVPDETREPESGESGHETTPASPETHPTETRPTETLSPIETTTTPESETVVPVPDGCYPIASVDVSQAEHGIGYILSDGVRLPQRLPEGGLWSTDGSPAVLIINTHPYEGYSSGAAWYDPAEGSLAVTDTPNATDGVVALGTALTRTLREAGVTVIHLRIAVSASDTAAEIYNRTETMVRYYCRLYPDIGLVLNLRRSAELTEDGCVLRTAGSLDGEACGQVRISVSGGREESAVGRDLAVALALRAGLWEWEPTISRPVWVKSGNGPASDLTDVCLLTLDMGSAGNTYTQAARLIPPLARILADLTLDTR